MQPVLVVIGGLPAAGKSTIARALATEAAAPYVRVDRIEQAIVAWSTMSHPVGPVGYAVAHQLALETPHEVSHDANIALIAYTRRRAGQHLRAVGRFDRSCNGSFGSLRPGTRSYLGRIETKVTLGLGGEPTPCGLVDEEQAWPEPYTSSESSWLPLAI